MVATLITLCVTVLTGVLVLGFWWEPALIRLDRPTISGIAHTSLAGMTVVVCILFAVIRTRGVGLAGVALILATAVAGICTVIFSGQRERIGAVDKAMSVPAPVLVVHALSAAGTIVAVVLAYRAA
ncbi:MAG: hypothetical protein ABI658_23310 [Acidimicrobiales bacterium]